MNRGIRFFAAASVGAMAAATALPSCMAAYNPSSPEVVAAVDRAVAYLETGQSTGVDGARALVGLAMLKAEKPTAHPLIQQAIAASRRQAMEVAQRGVGEQCYEAAICCMFLAELDAQQYGAEVEYLVRGMLARQRKNGAWGYKSDAATLTYDDTSQSQYAVLCLWAAHTHGVPVPGDSVERALNWFMRTQDVSGGWTYQSQDPGTLQRIQQAPPTHSMSAGGLGSVYVCAYLLGMGAKTNDPSSPEKSLPGALRPVETEAEKARGSLVLKPTATNPAAVRSVMAMGNSWFARNQRFDVPNYTYYYMYAFERYKSFQESLEGKTEAEPRWYSQGTEYLIRTQQKDGSWNWGQSQGGSPDVNAAWALLFLLRGTRKSLQQNTSEQGSLLAGKSLPKNLSQIRVNAKGQIIDETQVTPIDEMLALLEDGNGPASDFIEGIPNELDLAGDPAQRASQIARLRRLASAGSFQARLTAVGTLGRDRNLDNVPALIFALSDPDLRIREAALKGLQFVSRKFGAFAVPEDAPPAQWLAAQAKWKQWYLSIRPEGTLLH